MPPRSRWRWGIFLLLTLQLLTLTAHAQDELSSPDHRQPLWVCLSDGACLDEFARHLEANQTLRAVFSNRTQPGLNLTQALAGALGTSMNLTKCCYRLPAEFLHVIGEVTPQLALLRWQLSLPHQGGDPGLPEELRPMVAVEALHFNSSDDIASYWLTWQQEYVLDVTDAQYQCYTLGLPAAIASNPDNAGQTGAHPKGLLYPRLYYLLFYRPSVLARFGINPGSLNTWEGLLAAGQRLQGQDFDGDGQVDYPFCLDLAPGCNKAAYLYSAIVASLVQAHGTGQGWCWDPVSMKQLIIKPDVGARVAQVLAGLAALAQPDALTSCNATNNLFANNLATNRSQARCAFTFDWDIISNLLGPAGPGDNPPAFGALLTPGVMDPYNRTSGQFEPCTPYHCPFAQVEDTGLPDTPSALVNRAPLSTLAVADMEISALRGRDEQLAAESLAASNSGLMSAWTSTRDPLLRSMAASWQTACDGGQVSPLPDPMPMYLNNSGVQPIALGTSADPCAVPDWTSLPAGVVLGPEDQWQPLASFSSSRATLQDMRDTLPALWQARWHPNGAPDLSVPLATFYRAALDELAVGMAAAGSADPAVVGPLLLRAQAKFNATTQAVSMGMWVANLSSLNSTQTTKAIWDQLYRDSINFLRPDVQPASANSYEGDHNPMSTAEVVVLAVVPSAVVLLAAAVLVLCWARAWRHRSLLLGKVKAPGLSPNTTLMITDIYNSTVLWEALPSSVMDTALRLHHQVIRTAAAKNAGYESALEGDAFILAFHTPLDAARAALEVQAGLMAAPWPHALLQHPDACEVWVSLPHASVDAAAHKGGLMAARTMAAVFTGPGFHTGGEVFAARKRARASKQALQPIRKHVEGTSSVASDGSSAVSRKLRRLARWLTPQVERHEGRPGGTSIATTGPESQASVTSLEISDSGPLSGLAPPAAPLPDAAAAGPASDGVEMLMLTLPPLPPPARYGRMAVPPPLSTVAALHVVPEVPTPVGSAGAAGGGGGDLTRCASSDSRGGTKPLLTNLPSPHSNRVPSRSMRITRPPRQLDLESAGSGGFDRTMSLGRRRSVTPHSQLTDELPSLSPRAATGGAWHHPALLQRAGTMLGLWRSKLGAGGQSPQTPPRSFTLTRVPSSRWQMGGGGQPMHYGHGHGVSESSAHGAAMHGQYGRPLLARYAEDEDMGPASELRHHASEPNYLAAARLAWPAGVSGGTRGHTDTGAAAPQPAPQLGSGRKPNRLALDTTTMAPMDDGSGDTSSSATTPGDASHVLHMALSLEVDGMAAATTGDGQALPGEPLRSARRPRTPARAQDAGGQAGAATAIAGVAPPQFLEPLSFTSWREQCAAAWPKALSEEEEQLQQQQQRAAAALAATSVASADGVACVADAGAQVLITTSSAGSKLTTTSSTGSKLGGQGGKPALLKSGASSAALLFRGLRVRMGLHSGVHQATEMSLNRTTQATAYSGYPLKLAKAVGDAAAGGMILLSGSTFNLLANQLATLPGSPTPVYMGDSLFDLPGVACNPGPVGDGAWARDAVPLYCLVVPELRPRLAHQEALRGVDMVQLGNLDAAMGVVCIAFVYVAGAAGLVAELGPVGVEALEVFQLMVTKLCCDHGGYVIEATEGLCLAAFADPAACALWALSCVTHMKQHAWEPALLAHELCQEVVTMDPVTGQLTPVQRGPRLRAGLHTGHCEVHVNPRTGRMAYRGRVMNRAARIASKAQDGQVLCSAAALAQWGGVPSPAAPLLPAPPPQPPQTTVPKLPVVSTRGSAFFAATQQQQPVAAAGAPGAAVPAPAASAPAPLSASIISAAGMGSNGPVSGPLASSTLLPFPPASTLAPARSAPHTIPPPTMQPAAPQAQLLPQQQQQPQQLLAGPARSPEVVQERRHLLRAQCVGTFALKGVSEMMALYACSLADPATASAAANGMASR